VQQRFAAQQASITDTSRTPQIGIDEARSTVLGQAQRRQAGNAVDEVRREGVI
jgi:hypothetical protein